MPQHSNLFKLLFNSLVNQWASPVKILTQLYPKLLGGWGSWKRIWVCTLTQVKETTSIRQKTSWSVKLLWVNKTSAKIIPRSYKNKMTFQCSFPSFLSVRKYAVLNSWFFLCFFLFLCQLLGDSLYFNFIFSSSHS